jgi:hypothetical protein
MTRDQKKVLRALGTFVAFKALLYLSIHYAARVARETISPYETGVADVKGQIGIKIDNRTIGNHATVRDAN